MAKQKTEGKQIIIQQIDIRQISRNSVDIDKWRSAITSAENPAFPRRKALYDLYADILLDSHLRSVIDKRVRAVSNTPIIFVNADGTENEEMTRLIRAPWFLSLIKDVMWAQFWGHGLYEFTNLTPELVTYNMIPYKHVVPEFGFVLLAESDTKGIEYRLPPYDRTCVEVVASDSNGLLINACPWVIYKRNGFADFAQFLELFGMPLREGEYDGQDENARVKLLDTLTNMGSGGVFVRPAGTSIKFHEAQGKGDTGNLHKTFVDICNAEISKLILGNTLTTEQGESGARSLGTVHMEVEESVNADDRLYVENFLNYTFLHFLQLNGIVKDGSFLFSLAERISKTEKIKIDSQIKQLGVPIDDQYFYDTYGIPRPDNYDELKAEMQQQNAQQQIPDNTISAALESEKRRKGFRFF